MKMKRSVLEVLAVLGTGALLTACSGSQPVNATEVPASTMPAGAPTDAAPAMTGAAPTAPAMTAPAAPTAMAPAMPSAMASATPASMPTKKDMPKGNKTVKVKDSNRAKACEAGCGAGTCGSC